jgi:hypothetical protein
LFHGLRGRCGGTCTCPAARHLFGGGNVVGSGFSHFHPSLFGESGNGGAGGLLGQVGAAFPTVDCGERYAEPLSKLLLRKIELGADGAQRGGNGV